MKPLLLFLIFLIPALAVAKDAKIDSLNAILKKNPDSIPALLKLSEELHYTQPDSVKKMCFRAIDLCNKSGETQYKPRAYNELGNTFFVSGNLDSALFYYSTGVSSSRSIKDKTYEGVCLSNVAQILTAKGSLKNALDTLQVAAPLLALETDAISKQKYMLTIYGDYGDIYTQVGLFDTALANLFKAVHYANLLNDDNAAGSIYTSIGSVYSSLKEYDNSIVYYQKALGDFEKQAYELGIGLSHYNLAEAFSLKNALNSSLAENAIALKIFSKENYTIGLGFAHNLYGNIYEKQGNFEQALRSYLEAISADKLAGTMLQLGQARTGLAGVYLKQKKYSEADSQLTEALSIFQKAGSVKDTRDAYMQLAQLATSEGDNDAAAKYYQKYVAENEIFLNEERNKEITKQQIIYGTSIKEAQIARQQTEIKYGIRQNMWLTYGVFVALLAALSLALLYRRIRKQNRVIERQKKDILHTTRNNVARLISIFNQQAEDPALKQYAEANGERLFTLNLLNKLLYETNGGAHVELKEYLTQLCAAKRATYNVPIDLQVNDNTTGISLDLIKDVGLIVNELTTNAAKYAFNNTANPTIRISAEKVKNSILRLVLQDNGKGFPADFDIHCKRTSFGLQFVQDVVAHRQGILDIANDNGVSYSILLKI